MKKIIVSLFVISVLVSCKKTEKKSTEKEQTTVETVTKKQTTKQTFTADDGNLYNVTYTFEKNQPVAKLECDGYTETLSQTEAWAKGAEYSAGDYKLVSKGDSATLYVKGKKFNLSLK